MQQLVICLNLAVRELYRLGAATTLARLFQWQLSPALDLIRRACPALSEELLQMVETSAGLRDEFLARRKAPRPPAGRRRGSILVGGSEFRMDDAGTVLRDERPSSFRINRERSYHVLVDQEDPEFRLRRHYGASGRIMALLDAALLLVESDTTERMWSIRCPHGEEIPGFLPGSRYDPERGRKLDAEQQALDARKAARVRKP